MSLRIRVPSLVLALAVSATGCSSTPDFSSDPFDDRPGFGQEGVKLTVENQNYQDATVYMYWNGVKDRVGLVTGKTTKTFDVRWRSEDVQLEVDFVGGGGHWSEHIAVFDGDHLNYIIRPTGAAP